MIVYKIVNCVNGDFYIGKTTKKLSHRIQRHFSNSSGCVKFKAAVAKYGTENFLVEILVVCSSVEELNNTEIRLIRELKPVYNITCGGDGGATRIGYKHREDAKQKISKALTGGNHPMYGKKHSKESISKISVKLKGNKNHKLGKEFWLKYRDKIIKGSYKPLIDKITGKQYASPKEYSEATGYSMSYLYCILSGHKKSKKLNIEYLLKGGG